MPVLTPSSGSPITALTSTQPEVFHVKNNIFSFADAPAVCKLFGAELASLEQLKNAHSKGADWCSGGWTKEGLVAYPIQQETYDKLQENDPKNRGICGMPGINKLRNDQDLLYGVNCFGAKREAQGLEKIKSSLLSDKDIDTQNRMARLKSLPMELDPFNITKWHQ
jgi:hypothetical protein